MWKELNNAEDVRKFMIQVHGFHDACLKELKHVSGAYVDDELFMHPVNDRRRLNAVFQMQQDEGPSMIELEFSGLKYCRLVPCAEDYTCEIMQATLLIENGTVYWSDERDMTPAEFASSDGTVICASKLRWRPVDGAMGPKEVYNTSR